MPLPCNLIGPLLSYPGEIPKRQNGGDRISLVIKRDPFYKTS